MKMSNRWSKLADNSFVVVLNPLFSSYATNTSRSSLILCLYIMESFFLFGHSNEPLASDKQDKQHYHKNNDYGNSYWIHT